MKGNQSKMSFKWFVQGLSVSSFPFSKFFFLHFLWLVVPIHYERLSVGNICLSQHIIHLLLCIAWTFKKCRLSCGLIFCYFAGWKKRVKLVYLFEGAEALRNRDDCLDDHAQRCPPQLHRRPGHRGLLHPVPSAGTQHLHRHPVRGVPPRVRWGVLPTSSKSISFLA